jgi:hypothetical protein
MARGGRRVLGVVVQTDRGRLDNATAVQGANVYSCDKLDTEPGGVLRVKVGSSQLFLSASSAAALEDEGSAIQALAMRGSVGFASAASDTFSVRTPAGVVRAAGGQAASGQVTFASPQKLLISAIRGDLSLDTGGEFRTIPEGKSAEVTFEGNIDSGCRDEAAADQFQAKPYAQHKIGFYLIMGGAVAIPTYFIWQEMNESDTKPKP